MKSVTFKLSAMAFSATLALLCGACSDDGSGDGVTHGEFTIPIPEGLADDDEGDSTDLSSSSTKSDTISSSAKSAEGDTTKSTESKADVSSESKAETSSESKASSSSETKTSSSSEAKSSAGGSDTPKSWRDECLNIINEYRATEGKPALSLAAEEKQTCTDKQAANDLKDNSPHGHFRDCEEWAQNTGPNVNLKWKSDTVEIAKYYLDMMWDEKKLIEKGERDPENDDDYSYIGHYLNMSSTKYKTVSCGFATNSDNTTGWLNVNFY